MPCPFAFSVQLLYSSWSDVLVLTATAPLERFVLAKQVGLDDKDLWLPNQPVSSLWHGNGVRILHAALGRSFFQFSLAWWKQGIKRLQQIVAKQSTVEDEPMQNAKTTAPSSSTSSTTNLLATFGAGLTSFILLYPLQYAVFYLTLDTRPAGNTADGSVSTCLRERADRDGILALYRGLGMRIVAFVGQNLLVHSIYPRVRPWLEQREGTPVFVTSWVTSLFTSILASTVTFGVETVGRRQQLGSSSRDATTFPHVYAGWPMHVANLMIQETVSSLYGWAGQSDVLRRWLMKLIH